MLEVPANQDSRAGGVDQPGHPGPLRFLDEPVAKHHEPFGGGRLFAVDVFSRYALPSHRLLPDPLDGSIRSRATSMAAAASRPQRDGLCGLANFSSIQGRIAAATSGATGVVA